jgi:hypothetical protein
MIRLILYLDWVSEHSWVTQLFLYSTVGLKPAKWIPVNPASGRYIMKHKIQKFCKIFPEHSSVYLENRKQRHIATIVIVFVFTIIFGTLSGCSGILKSSGVITSHEATAIWHTYEVRPNYNYYYASPDTRPFYIWFNYYRPRVGGYNPLPYGAFINGPNGERIGLWYSVVDWRLTGSVIHGENNEVTVLMPTDEGRLKRDRNPYEDEFSVSNDENDGHNYFWLSRYSGLADRLR